MLQKIRRWLKSTINFTLVLALLLIPFLWVAEKWSLQMALVSILVPALVFFSGCWYLEAVALYLDQKIRSSLRLKLGVPLGGMILLASIWWAFQDIMDETLIFLPSLVLMIGIGFEAGRRTVREFFQQIIFQR